MKKTILLVEDDPFLADIYKTKLEKSDFQVILVTDGEKALMTMEESKPNLLLLDIVLPTIDGWEILRKIKKNNSLKDIPVIIISNLGQKGEVEKGLAAGATKYLIKAHYTPSEVVKEIKEVLTSKNG